MIKYFIYLLPIAFLTTSLNAQNYGRLEGKIIEHPSNTPIVGATVALANGDELRGVISDTSGFFQITELPFGNYTVTVNFLGYEEKTIKDIAIYDPKGVFLEVSLAERITSLEEVVVSAYKNPVEPTDPLASLSVRSISVEETKRFAGGIGDPSRMALSYAGVNSGRGDNNELIVRGNSAKYLQWKLEGLEIPNPNHFGVYGSSGGLLNILNANNLGRSTFYLGAFPAHTGNSLTGVFDLSLRNGSPTKNKHSIETSLIGLSAASEGPLKLTDGANYIINYRYSTLGLMKQLGLVFQAPDYQDLTFKVNIPTKKAGSFTIYGLGGLGKWLEEDFFRRIDSTTFNINSRGDSIYGFNEIAAENLNRYNLGIIGLKHSIPFNEKLVFTNHINFSVIFNAPRSSDYNREDFAIYLKEEGRFNNAVVRYQPTLNAYLNNYNTIYAGGTFSHRTFNSKLIEGFSDYSTKTVLNHTATLILSQTFISWKNTSINRLKTVLGAHFTYFNLNKQYLLEPRFSLSYQLKNKSKISFATGLHSVTENPEVYLILNDSLGISNRNLKMSRSWQSVLAYKKELAENLFFTAEFYHQFLFDIPIAADSSNFSLINEEVSFADIPLVNEGKGLNYGIEITLEKFFSNSYYFLITTSLFQSEYKLNEQFYRKTRFSNSYVVNFLAGKEFKLKKNRFIGVNLRGTFSGGKPYIPISREESISTGTEIRDEMRKYFSQLPPYIGIDFSTSYKWILPKVAHEIKLDIFRLFEQNYYDEVFVPERLDRLGAIIPATVTQVKYGEGQTATTLLPVLLYKLTF